jgi:hypothetical protein
MARVVNPKPCVRVDGERILAALASDVRAGAMPVTDFAAASPLLDVIFSRIAGEFLAREERVPGGGRQAGGGRGAPDYAAVEAAVRRRWPEHVALKGTGRRECLDRYRELVAIGSGRYGTVYSAGVPEDTRAGARYALKAVAVHPFAQPLQYQNLLNEIEIGTRMGELGVGPRVAAVHWCREDDGLLVMIVTDLMTRGDLLHFSRQRAVTDAHLAQVRRKLRAMHAAGFLHNDLHARNVLVTERPSGGFELFIGDYGFAAAVTPETEPLLRAEARALGGLRALVARDRLRGVLYRMVADGRLEVDIDFRQTAAEGAGEGSDDAAGTPITPHPRRRKASGRAEGSQTQPPGS